MIRLLVKPMPPLERVRHAARLLQGSNLNRVYGVEIGAWGLGF